LLLGIFGVERVNREEAWERYAVSPARLGLVRQEWNESAPRPHWRGLTRSIFGERFARAPAESIALPANHVAKRSDSARAIFDQAEQRAGRWGTHW